MSETCPPLGILIAGGVGGDAEETAELFIPSIGFQCALTDIPAGKGHHAQVGDVLCGGYTDSGTSPDCIRKPVVITIMTRSISFVVKEGQKLCLTHGFQLVSVFA